MMASGPIHSHWGSTACKALSYTLMSSSQHNHGTGAIASAVQGACRVREARGSDCPRSHSRAVVNVGCAHCSVWHELRLWFHKTRRNIFSKVGLIYSLAPTFTLALGRELRFMAALITTGAFAYPNKAYSTRAGTSWHVAWDANRSDSARQNSLDWQLFPCPAVQQMGDEQQSGLAGTNISAFLMLFVCQGNETGEWCCLYGRGRPTPLSKIPPGYVVGKRLVSRWGVWVSP